MREICTNIAELLKKKYNLKESFKDALELLKNPLPTIGAQLVSAVASLSAQIVSVVSTSTSSLVSAILAPILSAILTVLLSGPTALLALLSAPVRIAKDAADQELIYLKDINNDFNNAMRIISKWLSGFGGEIYYDQMKNALPYIENAIKLTGELIANFNTDKYNRFKADTLRAIGITAPVSAILNKFGVGEELESKRLEYVSTHKLTLDAEYKDKKIAVDDLRNSRIDNGDNIAIVDAQWEYDMSVLDVGYKADMLRIVSDSKKEFSLDAIGVAIENGYDRVHAEFSNDMKSLETSLVDMLKNIKGAYIKNTECQAATNGAYHAIDRLKALMSWFIKMANKASASADEVVDSTLTTSRYLMQDTTDKFNEDIDRYSKGKIDQSQLAIDVAVGNIKLIMSDTLTSSIITDSLVRLLDLEDALGNQYDDFEKFKIEIAKIKDWDGADGIWGVDIANSATSPYIQLIVNMSKIVAKAPFLKPSLRSEIRDVKKEIRNISIHANDVLSVLSSYDQYTSPEVDKLMRLLNTFNVSHVAIALAILNIDNLVGYFDNELQEFSLDCNQYWDNKTKAISNTAKDDENSSFNRVSSEILVEATGNYSNHKVSAASITTEPNIGDQGPTNGINDFTSEAQRR